MSLQLDLWTGHREAHPQELLSTQALSPTLRCCEGGMEEMGETVYLVLVGLKDREERLGYRDQLELGEKRGSKVPGIPRTTRTEVVGSPVPRNGGV